MAWTRAERCRVEPVGVPSSVPRASSSAAPATPRVSPRTGRTRPRRGRLEPAARSSTEREPRTAGEVVLETKTADRAEYEVGDRVTLVMLPGDPPQRSVRRSWGSNRLRPGRGTASARCHAHRRSTPPPLRTCSCTSRTLHLRVRRRRRRRLRRGAARPCARGARGPTSSPAPRSSRSRRPRARSSRPAVLQHLSAGLRRRRALRRHLPDPQHFSMLVAQRTRELALLRALGASSGRSPAPFSWRQSPWACWGAIGMLLVWARAGPQARLRAFGLDLETGSWSSCRVPLSARWSSARCDPGRRLPPGPSCEPRSTGSGDARRHRDATPVPEWRALSGAVLTVLGVLASSEASWPGARGRHWSALACGRLSSA